MAELLVLVMPLALVGFIIWVALGRRRDRQEKQVEIQKEIIAKFASSADLQAFLKTDEGRSLFKNIGSENGGPGSLRERAISRIGTGIVLLLVGAGLMVLAHYADQPQITSAIGTLPSGLLVDIPPGIELPAAVLFLTGAGLIISSLVMLRMTPGEGSKS
jgi:hypothetical protein